MDGLGSVKITFLEAGRTLAFELRILVFKGRVVVDGVAGVDWDARVT